MDKSAAGPWLDDFLSAYYADRPVDATFIGVHEHDHRLPAASANGMGDVVATMEDLLARAPRSGADAGLDARLARGFLRIQLWEYASRHFLHGNPSTYTGEAAFGLISLFLTEYSPFPERLEACTGRMAALPDFLAAARSNVRSAPVEWTERAIRECDGVTAFLDDGLPILLRDHDCSSVLAARAGRGADRAAAAIADFRSWLYSDLRHRADRRHAAGEDALAMYVRHGHFIDDDPETIAVYAESELADAASRQAVAASALGAPDARSALAQLARSHPAIDEYPACFGTVWNRMRDVALERDLLTWPEFPIRYVPRPEWVRSAAPHLYFLFYRSPAASGRPAVHDYLVQPIDADMPAEERSRLLRETNDGVIKLNHVIHHGGIGHHIQNWHAFRAASRIGRIAAVDCASRIAMFCGGTMAEGWACYATDLMAEAGALSPLETFAELNGRVRMCARAVVDVRLHQGRLSIDEAKVFYERQAGMAPAAAHAEAVKNSMFPGAALMYLTGRDAIHRLRRELESRQGPAFSLRGFHDEFLAFGSVPVALIADAMTRRTAPEPGG